MQLVVYSERVLGLGAGGYGALLAAAGVGGLLSTVVNGRLAMSSRVSIIVVTRGALISSPGSRTPPSTVLSWHSA